MAGLVPAIHVFTAFNLAKAWIPGTRPGMTSLIYGAIVTPPSTTITSPVM
jgi:hypothetical protein